MKIKDLRNLIKEELENVIVSDYINENIDHLDAEELKIAARKILTILSSHNRHVRPDDLIRYSLVAQKIKDLDPILGFDLTSKITDREFKIRK